MKKISILEVESALKLLAIEVQTSEGYESWELIKNYIQQQRQQQIEKGTLIVENPA